MNTTYLAAVLALGTNAEAPAPLLQTATPLATPVPVADVPFVEARGYASGLESETAETPALRSLLSLGRAPAEGVTVLMTRTSVVPAQAGIVGPVYQSQMRSESPSEVIDTPRVVDLRSGA